MKTPKVVVIVSGGLVQNIMVDDGPADVCLVDYDVEGTGDGDDVVEIDGEACFTVFGPWPNRKGAARRMFKKAEKAKKRGGL